MQPSEATLKLATPALGYLLTSKQAMQAVEVEEAQAESMKIPEDSYAGR